MVICVFVSRSSLGKSIFEMFLGGIESKYLKQHWCATSRHKSTENLEYWYEKLQKTLSTSTENYSGVQLRQDASK